MIPQLPSPANTLEGILDVCGVCARTSAMQNHPHSPYIAALHYSNQTETMLCNNTHVTRLLPTEEVTKRYYRYYMANPAEIVKTELIIAAA